MNDENWEDEINNNHRVKTLARKKVGQLTEKEKLEWKKAVSWFFLTNFIKKKIRMEIESKMKMVDILIILLSGIGLITNAIQSLLYLKFEIQTENGKKSILVSGESSDAVEILRFITTFTTILAIILIVFHYKIRIILLIFKQQVDLESTLWSTGLLGPLIIEILFNLIHTPPYLNNIMINISTTDTNPQNVPCDLDLFFSVFVPFRVYLLFKFYVFYSKWGGDRAERVCKESNCEGGVRFALKAEIKDRPYLFVLLVLVASVVLFGYCIRNTEIAFMRDVPDYLFQDWTSLWNGLWCILITILTVGYGDYYPQTHLGRFIAIVACLWGTFLVSLMVVALTNSIYLDPQQQRAYNEITKTHKEKNYKKAALNLIRRFYNANLLLEYEKEESDDEFQKKRNFVSNKALRKLQNALDKFREKRKMMKALEKTITIETLIGRINRNLNEGMDFLVRASKIQVNSLLENIKQSKNLQNTIKAYVQVLENMTDGIYKKLQNPSGPNQPIIPKKVPIPNSIPLKIPQTIMENENVEAPPNTSGLEVIKLAY